MKETELDKLIQVPLSDDEINKYLGYPREDHILKYSELSQYKDN